jgi:hypothetical protein
MTDQPRSSAELVDLERLLPAAVAAVLRTQQWPDLLAWVRADLLAFAPAGSRLVWDPGLRAAFSFALARAVWNATPLPRAGFRTEPLPEPGRNEPCPCGSGRKFKQCCQGAPSLGVIDAGLVWPLVLQALAGDDRRAALASRQVPREALLQFAAEERAAGRAASAIDLLEPQFTEPVRHEDDVAGAMLHLLCDALDDVRGGKRRKLALLERMTGLPRRSPLRSEAWQRLACIHRDKDRTSAAWQAFQQAQRDDPGNELLGVLEVQLLTADGRLAEARDRARFHTAALRRRGGAVDPGLLDFYRKLADDPVRAMGDASLRGNGAPGRVLAACVDRMQGRPLPRYQLKCAIGADASVDAQLAERLRQMGLGEDSVAEAVRSLTEQISELTPPAEVGSAPPGEVEPGPELWFLEPPAGIGELSRDWRKVFPLGKSFSVQSLPASDAGVWAPESEARWGRFLEKHPEASDSLDILDDLASAVALHPAADQLGVVQRLGRPLVERAAAIVDAAIAQVADPRLPWVVAENRPALRALVRLMQLEELHEVSPQSLAIGRSCALTPTTTTACATRWPKVTWRAATTRPACGSPRPFRMIPHPNCGSTRPWCSTGSVAPGARRRPWPAPTSSPRRSSATCCPRACANPPPAA